LKLSNRQIFFFHSSETIVNIEYFFLKRCTVGGGLNSNSVQSGAFLKKGCTIRGKKKLSTDNQGRVHSYQRTIRGGSVYNQGREMVYNQGHIQIY